MKWFCCKPTPEPPVPQPDGDPDWTTRGQLLHKCWVQVRYHRRRQRFFDLADRLTKAATILLGSTLFGSLLKDFIPEIAIAITSLGLLSLIFGYSDRRQLHKELGEAAAKIIESIVVVSDVALTTDDVCRWSGEHAKLIARSPPALRALTIVCEVEQALADGVKPTAKMPWLGRRAYMHFY